MIDDIGALNTFLRDNATFLTAVGGRLWPGYEEPPAEAQYEPGDGPAVVFMRQGGLSHYENGIVYGRYMFKCYGKSPLIAYSAYRSLYDALFYQSSYAIMQGDLQAGPQHYREPETDWHYVLCYFTVWVRNTELA